MDPQNSLAFHRIRPTCVELSKFAFLPKANFDPASSDLLRSLRDVNDELNKLDTDGMQLSPKFADYVFVPLASLLKQDSLGDAQTEVLLLILSHLISLCWSTVGSLPRSLANQLFPLITFLISNEKENKSLKKKLPEFKLAGCKVLQRFYVSLAAQKNGGNYDFFSHAEILPSLGHSVSILLDVLLDNPQEANLQLAALSALSTLYKEGINDGEILSFILPGNVSAFSKVLTKPGIIVNYKVVCSTLELFATLLKVVYDDTDLKILEHRFENLNEIIENGKTIDNCEILSTKSIVIDESEFKGRKYHRDNKWLTATSGQIKIALNAVLPRLLKRDNRHINEKLNYFITTVLACCPKSLSNCVELLTKSLLEVNGSLSKLTNLSGLKLPVERVVDDQVAHLETYIQLDDTKPLHALCFALKSLSTKNALDMTLLREISKNVLDGLSNTVEHNQLRFKETKLIEQSSMIIIQQDIMVPSNTQHLLFPKVSSSMETFLCNFMESIGSFCDQLTIIKLVDWILSLSGNELSIKRSISLWMSSAIITGFKKKSFENMEAAESYLDFGDSKQLAETEPLDICYTVLEYAYEILDEFTQNGTDMTKDVEFHAALALSSVRMMVQVMGKAFKDELIDYLFPVVDCLASSSPVIRSFSQSTVLSIANELYVGSVHNLLLENLDYMVDAISIRLNNCMTERVTTVLMVICQIGGYEVIRRFQDVLETIFRLLDYYHGYDELCLEFFQLFDIIVMQMKKAYFGDQGTLLHISHDHNVSSTFSPWAMTSLSELIDILDKPKQDKTSSEVSDADHEKESANFQDYFDQKLREVDSDDEDDDSEDDESVEEEGSTNVDSPDKWISPIPKDSFKTLIQITNYGDRLLTHPSKPLRVQILALITKIIPLLSTQYNSMLPQIANCWDIIVECTFISDFTIAKVAYSCLREIIRCAGDFVSKRFIDLWETSKHRSPLLKLALPSCKSEVSNTQHSSASRRFPTNISEALIALSEMLLEGISQTELFISEAILQEMVSCCLLVLPQEHISAVSSQLGDFVYMLTN